MKAKKCWQRDGVFSQKEIIIKNDWAYCPLCGDCLFDIQIQDEDHWIFTLPKVIKNIRKYKYNEQLINKIADIRDAIPVEMFDEIHPSALGASVGCPYEALCFIEEIVKNLVKGKS